jgi:hypothetical protein
MIDFNERATENQKGKCNADGKQRNTPYKMEDRSGKQ